MTITATFVKDLPRDNPGIVAKLYRLSEPVRYDEDEEPTDHVVVSAANHSGFGIRIHETYIFPADEEGEVLNWLEMDGSEGGHTDHARAIENAGWKLDG